MTKADLSAGVIPMCCQSPSSHVVHYSLAAAAAAERGEHIGVPRGCCPTTSEAHTLPRLSSARLLFSHFPAGVMSMALCPPAVLTVLSLVASAPTTAAGSSGETGRVLVYPDQGGLHKFVVGLSVPVDVPKKFLSWAVNFQYQYQMPQNISELTQHHVARGRTHQPRLTRLQVFRVLQDFLDRNEVDGRACVLRTICQVAEMPLHHNGLLGELLHVLFTPAGGVAGVLDEYQTARAAGMSSRQDCQLLYPDCPPGHGLVDLITYDAL